VNIVSFFQEQFGQVGTILTCDSGYQGGLHFSHLLVARSVLEAGSGSEPS
jgi:hypothetical protein